MKIRKGFVSNSSSTAFVIFSKEKLTPEVIEAKIRGFKYNDYLNHCRDGILGNMKAAIDVISNCTEYPNTRDSIMELAMESAYNSIGGLAYTQDEDVQDRLSALLIQDIPKEKIDALIELEKRRDQFIDDFDWDSCDAIEVETKNAIEVHVGNVVDRLMKEYPEVIITEISDGGFYGEAFLEHSEVMLTMGDVVLKSSHH